MAVKINFTKVLTAVAIGVGDELLERKDVKAGKAGGFHGWTPKARLLAVLVGYGAGMFDSKYADIGETVALAATPLLTKSVVSAVMSGDFGMGKAGQTRTFQPRNVAVGPSVRNWVPTGAGGGGYRGIV